MFAPQVAKAQTKPASSPTSKLVPQRSTLAARPFGHGMVEQAHMLQQSISNQASLRLLAQRATSLTGDKRDGDCEQEIAPENMTALEAPRGVSWDFSRIPLFPVDRASDSQARHPRSGIIQPKLAVGEIDDPLEREADAVADHVMGMPDPAGPFIAAPSRLQRQCAACREDERTLRAKPSGADLAGGAEAPAQVHHLLRAPGEGLDAASRAFFEPRFGYDFADVRVHRGASFSQFPRCPTCYPAAGEPGKMIPFHQAQQERGA